MNFSWSTPLRRDGQTSLPLIPNETYLAIFECIAPSSKPLPKRLMKTFLTLALVCRFFCVIALPRVFERVEFPGPGKTFGNRDGGLGWLDRRIMRRAEQITENTEQAKSVALYVRECYFKYWRAPKGIPEFPIHQDSTLHCRAMARMVNIRTVGFYKSSVTKEHWDAMAALKQLDCLVFYRCTFAENPPDQELCVRTVKLVNSSTFFTLWPIATSTLHTLDVDELEPVLKLVTARQLTIEKFFLYLYEPFVGMELLFQVLEKLPGLENLIFVADFRISPPVSRLPLEKKLFTRLRSFTMIGRYGDYDSLAPDGIEKLISSICDIFDGLSSLEELDLWLVTSGGLMTTLDIVSDSLEGMIIPTFPNLKHIRTPGGDLRLENGGWKCYEAPFLRKYHTLNIGGLLEFG